MNDPLIEAAVADVPAGAWAVGVSGGADSVALLSALRNRPDLRLHVVHLDHQARGESSRADARFVEELANQWGLPCTSMRLEQVEPLLPNPPKNLSARFRAARFELFRRVAERHNLAGVILAHHADDQAETILQRLIRGSGYAGLAGMARCKEMNRLMVLRPLLSIRRENLREYLRHHSIPWREDESNASGKYLRNRLRKVLDGAPELVNDLLELGKACADLRDWARSIAPILGGQFRSVELSRLPRILADESARRWLIDRGAPADLINPTTIDWLFTMADDAASTPRQDFPGQLHVRRRAGVISISD